GATPELHYFLNHPDQGIRDKMAALLHPNRDISSRWREKYGIETLSGAMTYANDVESTLSYYELKKILIMQEQLTKKVNEERDPIKQKVYMERFLELRTVEREILQRHKTVVFKTYKRR